MKVGLLLNKELQHIPTPFKNSYKVERNKLFCRNREIEYAILLKKCQKLFKEINVKKLDSNSNHKNVFSIPKENCSKKIRTNLDLPFINIPNLKLDNTNIKSQKENDSFRQNKKIMKKRNSVNLENENKTMNSYRAKSNNNRQCKKNNQLTEKINRRYNMFEKTLNKLKKPLFHQKFDA